MTKDNRLPARCPSEPRQDNTCVEVFHSLLQRDDFNSFVDASQPLSNATLFQLWHLFIKYQHDARQKEPKLALVVDFSLRSIAAPIAHINIGSNHFIQRFSGCLWHMISYNLQNPERRIQVSNISYENDIKDWAIRKQCAAKLGRRPHKRWSDPLVFIHDIKNIAISFKRCMRNMTNGFQTHETWIALKCLAVPANRVFNLQAASTARVALD